METKLKFKKLNEAAALPARATPGSAGYDLRVCCGEEGVSLAPMERKLVPTGLAMELPGENTVGLVFARSGTALNAGLAMANGVGVIESDYRGEVQAPMVNLSAETVVLRHGERIAQLLVMPVLTPEVAECEELSGTARGAGGFGSTGSE